MNHHSASLGFEALENAEDQCAHCLPCLALSSSPRNFGNPSKVTFT
jgi:hypothetical protein